MRLFARPQAFCEFGEDLTRFFIVRFHPDHQAFSVLGYAEREISGYRGGHFSNLSDAAECLWAAGDEASRQAGVRLRRLNLSFGDLRFESATVRGSSMLEKNEDAFKIRHIEEAIRQARNAVKPSEKHLVYQGIGRFLIDGVDYLTDPVGLFGKELTVILHLLFCDAERVQDFRSLAVRAGFEAEGLTPSAIAALHGILAPTETLRRIALIHAQPAVCSVAQIFNRAVLSTQSIRLRDRYGSGDLEAIGQAVRSGDEGLPERVVLAGDIADEPAFESALREMIGLPVHRPAARCEDPHFQKSRFAVLVGLAWLNRSRREERTEKSQPGVLKRLQSRTRTFIDEYF